MGVVFHPNDNTLASCSLDKSIKLWNLDTGAELSTMSGHLLNVSCLAFKPDDPNILVSGSWDSTLKIWDLSTAASACLSPARRPGVIDDEIISVEFVADGRLVMSGDSNKTIRLCDIPAQTLQAWTPQAEMAADGQQGAAGIEPTIQKNKASQAVTEGGEDGFIEEGGSDGGPGDGGGDCRSRDREQRDREWDAAMVAMGVRGGNGGVGSGGRVVYEADGRACGEWRWVEDGDDIDEDEETQVTTPRDLVPALIRVLIQSHTTPAPLEHL